MSRQWRSDDTSKWVHGFGNGSDGDLTISSNTTDVPIDSSCSGISGATSLSATNASFSPGQLVLIHQSRGNGVGSWELNKIAAYTVGTITLAYPLQNTYTDSGASQAQVLVMKQYRNVTINSGVSLTAKDWNQDTGGILAFFVKGTLNVLGSIVGTGRGYIRGAGGGDYWGRQAEGTAGGGGGFVGTANGSGGGGGNGNNSTSEGQSGGGGGGHASSGGNASGANNPGDAGGSSGVAGLTTMTFGGAGGGGNAHNAGSGWDAGGGGGDGGGILCLFGRNITITGSVVCGGGNGSNGNHSLSGGGGAGAGGSVLYKAENLVLGTNLTTAVAGSAATRGGSGSVGRIHADYRKAISGTTSPTIDARLDSTIKPNGAGNMLLAF